MRPLFPRDVTAPKKGVEPYSYWVSPSRSYFACIRGEAPQQTLIRIPVHLELRESSL